MAIGKQLQAGLFAENAGNGPGARFIVTCEGHTIPSNISEKQQEITPGFRNQILQTLPDGSKVSHRAGVSFCFSKKAQLKLESSASVFTENSEEATDGPEPLTLKLKQSSNGFRYLALLRDDTETNQNTASVTSQDHTGNSILINVPTENTILKEAEGNFSKSLKIPDDHLTPDPICNEKCSDENRENSTNKLETTVDSKECEKPSETEASFHCQTNIFYTQQNKCNKHSNALLMESSAELSSSLSVSIGPVAEAEGSAIAQNTETGLKEADTVHENEDSPTDKGLANGVSPEAMSFLHVVSKDGNTVLQWPTELLLYTKTQPSISYGCNPLYFDFKLSGNSKPSKDNAKVDGKVKLEINSIIEDESFDLVGHEEMPSKQETTSKEPKPKCSFNRLSQQNFETCTRDNHKNCGTSKQNSKTFYENGCVISPHINIEEKCDLEVKTFLKRKRKYVLQDKFADMDNDKLSRKCDQTALPPGNAIKKHKKEHCAKGKSEYEIRPHHHYTSHQTQCKCPASTHSDSPEDSLSNKACSCCKHSGYDSDGCSLVGCCRLSWTHSSPSGRHSTNSDTSIYSLAGSHYCRSPGQRSSDNSHRSHSILCCKKRKERIEESPWKHGKHRYSSSSEEEVDSMVQTKSHRVRKREEKNYLKKEKHKESEGRSRHRCSQNKHRSKRRKAKHRLSRKEPSGCYSDENSGRTQSKPISSSENSGNRRFSDTTSELFSTDQAQSLKANKETCREQDTHPHNLQTGETIASACLNEASGFKSNSERLPTIITTDSVLEEKVQLEETLLLDTMQLELRSRNEHESKDSPEDLTVELYNQSKDVFPVQLSPPHASSSVLPLFETVCTTSTTSLQNCEAGASGGTEKKAQFGETQEYKVTLTAHTEYEHCHFKDIIRIGGDCQSLSTEKPAAIHEQSSPLISQVKPFIHSCNPLPNDFPCALPSHRYSVVSDSTETKEEQIKLGLHDVNMDPSPQEEQLNYYYDSTMQNYGDSEHLFEVYDKSCSPPLPQQTIAFSHEEIDKYRRLEMQAQQQMHTQFVAKHLKVFPVSGPTAFSTPPVVHPVPVQQQTAITTIHHTLLQRCALSATVHSHNNNFPVAHVHPLAQAHFTPIAISHLAPAVIPAHTTFFAGHPLHLFSATAIHPGQLTLHAVPHAALIPTLFSPHLGTGASSAVHLHPLIHPLFPAQEFQHSGPGQTL